MENNKPKNEFFILKKDNEQIKNKISSKDVNKPLYIFMRNAFYIIHNYEDLVFMNIISSQILSCPEKTVMKINIYINAANNYNFIIQNFLKEEEIEKDEIVLFLPQELNSKEYEKKINFIRKLVSPNENEYYFNNISKRIKESISSNIAIFATDEDSEQMIQIVTWIYKNWIPRPNLDDTDDPFSPVDNKILRNLFQKIHYGA